MLKVVLGLIATRTVLVPLPAVCVTSGVAIVLPVNSTLPLKKTILS